MWGKNYASLKTGLPRWLSGKESACSAGDVGSIPGLRRSPGGRNGNPLQYSCLENPMDRGAWWATVRGVMKNQMWLSDWTTTNIQELSLKHFHFTSQMGWTILWAHRLRVLALPEQCVSWGVPAGSGWHQPDECSDPVFCPFLLPVRGLSPSRPFLLSFVSSSHQASHSLPEPYASEDVWFF